MQELKLIVAGSRGFRDYELLKQYVELLALTTYKDFAVSIVSGMAKGADSMAADFAKENKIKLYKFPANWDGLGKQAGFIRNTQMGIYSDALIVFWDGVSNGTKHMIEFMEKQKKPVHIIYY